MNSKALAPICYEDCERDDDFNMLGLSNLHWALLFRRFDVVQKILSAAQTEEEVTKLLHSRGTEDYPWMTPLVCARWNWDYLLAYDENRGTNITSIIIKSSKNDESFSSFDPVEYYESIPSFLEKSIFDIVWGRRQPMLGVIQYEKQKIASQQVKKNGFSLVLDEVGTGKTVSAFYALRDVIEDAASEERSARILIVCPYSKRSDWQNDIRRQLGRHAHVVEQSDEGELYLNRRKEAFFRKGEHIIIISGQKQSKSDKEGNQTALKGSLERFAQEQKWDIVIIDEGHQAFDNYQNIRANRAMLLTATPIVVSSGNERTFHDYYNLLASITERGTLNYGIGETPISIRIPKSNDWFVNWFREDMGKQAAKRNIRFIPCERNEKRWTAYTIIKKFNGPLAALHADQDDTYLLNKAKAVLEQNNKPLLETIQNNRKLDRLVELLKGKENENDKDKSFLIFCEHLSVARQVYDTLRNSIDSNCMIGLKTGSGETSYPNKADSGMLIDIMANAHRDGKRTILITTGKKSGVGLNLGWFDGVIHYELPFTSIELEQQFGRVDRIDVTDSSDKKIEKDMIFLLNQSTDQEEPMLSQNPMLEYCVTKLDVTCRQMPVRNTVLFIPDFYGKIIEDKRKSLEHLESEIKTAIAEGKESAFLDAERKKMQLYIPKRKNNWDYVKSLCSENKTPLSICEYALTQHSTNDLEAEVGAEYLGVMADYRDFANNKAQLIEGWSSVKREFGKLKRETMNYLRAFGIVSFDENSQCDMFYGEPAKDEDDMEAAGQDINETDDEDEPQMQSVGDPDIIEDTEETDGEKMCKEIEALCNDLSRVASVTSLRSDGIYWYQNNRICLDSVKNFRSGQEVTGNES